MHRPVLQLQSLKRDLQAATADCYQLNPSVGLWRFGSLGLLLLCFMSLAWLSQSWVAFVGLTAIAGLFYAFLLICTHDMMHHTLTGWDGFETVIPRLLSWPMLWPYGLYAELHRLHHGWNGINLQDPERVQWTDLEYQAAAPWQRWYVRHQWPVDLLGLGGLGMIVKTLSKAWLLRAVNPRLKRQLLVDSVGIGWTQIALLSLVWHYQVLLQYLVFWLVLERVIGFVAQTRDHLEHYGLWQQAGSYQLTQLYACRNLKAPAWVSWLMGGLNYHAVHHAFPDIPFNQLPRAFAQVQQVLQQHQLPPMSMGEGYFQETLWFLQHPALIDESNRATATGRYPKNTPAIAALPTKIA
ncbi:fatty acid desaturase family protein [Almyronema epifaneia]|uniref:Fatty acid desaturase family protein n=1 Tax=Almyronema epifaneia S1 TaxID=2991925 RepID=A0ABW6IFN3_9CYAN